MKNAIVYSIHSNSPKLDPLIAWRQIRYSIDTLRIVNKKIPVKVYISPPGIIDTAVMPYQSENIEYIEFNATADKRIDDANKARLTGHKWISTFNALEKFDFDNVIYVDGDTVWYKDPEILFEKYGGSEHIYSKQDRMDNFVGFLGIEAPVMNDGVNMVSKKVLKYKDYILKERYDRVFAWQERFRNTHDEQNIYGIQWLSCQYAVSEAMKEVGIPVKYFDIGDVLLASDPMGCHYPEKSGAVLFHYLAQNTNKFLPKWYNISVGVMTPAGKITKIYRKDDQTFAIINNNSINVLALVFDKVGNNL